MSASLVGSEMCIRDRGRCVGPARCLCAWGADAWPCADVRVRARRCLVAPVSYTHLTLPTICSV
eukprot:5659274-Alexandrium_andersonii.AAC.1